MKKIIFKHIGLFLLAAWVYTLTFVFNNYWSKSSSMPAIASSMQKRVIVLQKKFQDFYSDTQTIKKCLSFSDETIVQNNTSDAGPFYYLFADSPDGFVLKYWSTSAVAPKLTDIPYHDTVHLVTYENGMFILSVHPLPDLRLFAAQLIPIKWHFFIQNNYLTDRIPGIDGLGEQIDINTDSVGSPVKLQNGTTIFSMRAVDAKAIHVFNWPSFLITIITTILLITFFQRVANDVVAYYSFSWGFLLIVLAAIFIRLLIFFFNFPINTEQIQIFTRFSEGNGFWFHSLGDLFLHLFAFIWVFYFLQIHQQKWLSLFDALSGSTRKILALSGIVFYMSSSFWGAHIIQELASQSEFFFDVSNIFRLGWPTFFSITCLYFILSIHYFILHFCNKIYDGAFNKHKYYKFWAATVLGLIVLTFFIKIIHADLMLFVMIWSLLCLLLEQWLPQINLNKPLNINNFLFWMLWYAFSGSVLLLAQNTQKNEKGKLGFAQRQTVQSDPVTESLLYQATNTQFMQELVGELPQLSNKEVAEKAIDELHQKYFSSFLTKPQTSFYLFNNSGFPIYQKDSISFSALNTIYTQQALPTKHPYISYYESSYATFSYIIKRSLFNDSLQLIGYLFITYAPFQKETFTPELFRRLQSSDPNFTGNLTYAIYGDSNLISSNKDYPFKTMLDKKERLKQQIEIRHNNGTDELWYNAGNNKTIVVVKTSDNFTDGITLFAYLFGIFILFIPIRNLIANLLGGNSNLKRLPSISKLSIRNQIQKTILTLSTVSFVIIGTITVVFFIYRFHTNNNVRLTKTIERVNNDMEAQQKYAAIFDKKNNSINKERNTITIQATALSQNVDINLFDNQGNLITSSQPILYDHDIVSSKINPTAFYHLSVKKEVQFMQAEHIGELEYNSIYLPIRPASGETVGYLNIPDFASQNELNQEISNFLVALINLFVLIFLLTGIITFIIANRITSSFAVIGEKMKNISFGKQNDPIDWQRNDEIGVLVSQYNRMLKQLDESANKLAKSERENAWREMAKQVAHEIKNPLTPMKLSLQYLQRAIDNNSPNVRDLTEKVATNMVEQIDHLSKIASDFSQFAHIGIEKKELLDLGEMLKQVVTLYENNRQVKIIWQKLEKPTIIVADKTQVNRLFTNLFQNAVQAAKDETVKLTITETIHEGNITICISDNGIGIPDELKDKIFAPSFTTKSSGTGLGLAISKDIVERMNGEIWFNTQLGEGTQFYVRVPLVTD